MTDVVEGFYVEPITSVPDGDYPGTWSGYTVLTSINSRAVQLRTVNGIRGINVPCVVRVRDGVIKVESAR